MRAIKTVGLTLSLAATFLVCRVIAQQPTPPMVIVQAATAATATPVPVKPSDSGQASAIEAATKALQEVKAANEEMLKKQEEMMQRLDELQKAAEQLKTFSKRS